jgi:hypothetical protein
MQVYAGDSSINFIKIHEVEDDLMLHAARQTVKRLIQLSAVRVLLEGTDIVTSRKSRLKILFC